MTRIAEPQLSFADLALRQQGVHLDPLLQGILTFLDQHAPLVEQVRQDLVRGLKNPHTGRGGITPSQTLRSLIHMRVKNWDYRELRERINDGYTLRGFTDFDRSLGALGQEDLVTEFHWRALLAPLDQVRVVLEDGIHLLLGWSLGNSSSIAFFRNVARPDLYWLYLGGG